MNREDKTTVSMGLAALAILGATSLAVYTDYRSRNAAADLMVDQYNKAIAIQNDRGLSQGQLFQAGNSKGSVAVVHVESLYRDCANTTGRLYTNTWLGGASVQFIERSFCKNDRKVGRRDFGL